MGDLRAQVQHASQLMKELVRCANCKCDTGASGFHSVARRIEDGSSPVWRAADCDDKSCVCHTTQPFNSVQVTFEVVTPLEAIHP